MHDNIYWQINAGGIGHDWPDSIKEKYQDYIINLDWVRATQQAHNEIHELHTELSDLKIPHLFFNTYNDFNNQEPLSWHDSYIDPYDPDMTYYKWLSDQGFQSNQSYHFRADAHRKWAEFLLPYLTKLL